MKHEFKDELRIKVDHDHEIQTEVVEELIDKVVEATVTIVAVTTVAYILGKRLS